MITNNSYYVNRLAGFIKIIILLRKNSLNSIFSNKNIDIIYY